METVKCAIYARYSSENQREASIEDQIRKCRESAASKGWDVLEDHIYIDKAKSGTSTAKRGDLNKMLGDVKAGDTPFEYILVDDTSRLSRDQSDSLQIIKELHFHSRYIYYVSQGIDSKSESASMMLGMNAIVDSQYIEKLSKATHRGIEGRFLNGQSTGGKRYGYISTPQYSREEDRHSGRRPDGYLQEVYEPEAEVVREIFHLYGVEEYGVKEIANILNKRLMETGQPIPPRSDKWSPSTISGSRKNGTGILNNEIYIGKRVWNRTTTVKNPETGKKVSRKRMPSDWVYKDAPHLRIVSDETWAVAKGRQDEIKHKGGVNTAKAKKVYSTHLLTGVAVCAECGGTFGIVSGGKKARYGCTTWHNKGEIGCSNRVKVDKAVLEEVVLFFLSQQLQDGEAITRIHEEFVESLAAYIAQLGQELGTDGVEVQLAEVEKRIRYIIDAICVSGITKGLDRSLQEAERMEKELLDKISVSATAGDLDAGKLVSIGAITEHSNQIADMLVDPDSSAQAFKQLIHELRVDCSLDGDVLLQLVENIEPTAKSVLKAIESADSRIRLQTGTRFVPYTSRIFKLRLHSNLSPTVDETVTNMFIERGLHA